MRVIVYTTTEPDVPEGLRCCARIRCAMPGKKGTVDDWHPVIFHGSDPDALAEIATDWWESELAKAATKKPKGRPPKDAALAPAADIGDVV